MIAPHLFSSPQDGGLFTAKKNESLYPSFKMTRQRNSTSKTAVSVLEQFR